MKVNRGLYISATSLMANQRKLEAVANNLSNVNTNGFKKDHALTETFPEVLMSKIGGRPDTTFARGENVIVYETDGETYIAQAPPRGYFVVKTPMGLSYVKDIKFIIDDDGYLKTYYKNEKDEYKTDAENYIADSNGNLIRNPGDIERLLQNILYYPNPRVIGTMNAGVKFQKFVTDFSEGSFAETGGKFDIAIKGPGFFRVEGEDGEVYYTRNGAFTLNRNGELVTMEGYRVLGSRGPITINDSEDVTITKDGQIISNGNVVGNLNVVDLENSEFLRKVGNNLFTMVEDVEPEEIPFDGEILQGYLEESNVDAIKEMVEMITLLRNFEMGQKAIRVQDEMLDKSSNELGRV